MRLRLGKEGKSRWVYVRWGEIVSKRETTGQCKGIFFTSFRMSNKFRRCEEMAEAGQDVCSLCKRMRKRAEEKSENFVSCAGQPEYEIIGKSLFTRVGVKECVVLWKEKAKEMQQEHKLQKDFPFYSAQGIISWLMLDGGAIFKNGGKGGRTYKRSAVMVHAQNAYLRECMENSLIILQFEGKKKFKQRFFKLAKAAEYVHKEMLHANVGSEMMSVGAIQKPDIVREELARAAMESKRTKKATKVFSTHVKRLCEWAAQRVQQRRGRQRSRSLSISSSSPPTRVLDSGKKSGKKAPLKLQKVAGINAKKQPNTKQAIAAFKKFEIKQSTIRDAGSGFFLMESAKHGEAIARYSGKLLSKKEMMQASSEYIIRVSEDQYLCAAGNDEWEGKYLNCARKARRKCNARFQANGKCNYCEISKKHYLKVYAVGSIAPGEEALADYDNEYWRNKKGELEPLPTPETNYKSGEDGENEAAADSDWQSSAAEENKQPKHGPEGIAKQLNFSQPESPEKEAHVSKRKRVGPLRQSSRIKLEIAARKAKEQQMKYAQKKGGEKWDEYEPVGGDGRKGHGKDAGKGKQLSKVVPDSDHEGSGPVGEGDAKLEPRSDEDKEESREEEESDAKSKEDEDVEEDDKEDDGEDDDDDEDDDEDDGDGEDDGEDNDEEEDEEGDQKLNPQSVVKVTPRKVYAVSVGRCVGLFRSVMRMRSSVLGYPGGYHKKFLSEQDAIDFLAEQGIQEPFKYWTTEYASGSLVQAPKAIVGRDVCFPVGNKLGEKIVYHGVVVEPVLHHAQWMWKVQMEHGRMDCVAEWPLLLGLHFAEKREEASSNSDESYFAVSGTNNDGIVRTMEEAIRRSAKKGPRAQMNEFATKSEAEAWLQQQQSKMHKKIFYAIRGTGRDGIVTSMKQALARLQGEDAQYEEFTSEKEAREWIEAIQFFAVRWRSGERWIVPC